MHPTLHPLARAICAFPLLALAALFALANPVLSQDAEPAAEAEKAELPLDTIRLPEGFSISIYSDEVPNARALALGEKGTIYVGSRREGKVYAMVDKDGDHKADAVHVLAEDLAMPTGLAYKDSNLYVAAINSLWRFDGIGERLTDPPEPVLVYDDLPEIRHHGWKYVRFGPDGQLYVPVGAPCNICDSADPVFAAILRMRPDGSERKIIAHGVRNTVGFDWHPTTGELWFTDNGRDWMGDDIPPDELNVLRKEGEHFGYPRCHGTDIPDPTFAGELGCSEMTTPVQELGPHVGALGMRFYTGAQFPADYKHDIFIAEHGSWNRSKPLGYRVMRVELDGHASTSYEVFAEGWLGEDGRPWGRPVDVEILPDGSLLVSDDGAGAVYRITYDG